MSRFDRSGDPVRQQFAARTRDYYLDKMRSALGMPAKGVRDPDQPAPPMQRSSQGGPPVVPQASTSPVCTCDDQGECDVCRAWSARMLELARGKP